MAEGAHQLALFHELLGSPLDLSRLDLGAAVVDLLGGADGSRILDIAVGTRADFGAGESHVRQHKRPQLRMLSKIRDPL